MKNLIIGVCVIILCSLNHFAYGEKGDTKVPSPWPEIKPFQSGYLQVSDIHKIYYEVSGNQQGKPIFFIHGGPGGESTPKMRQWADPGKFMIVLHDQRGAGQSQPLCETRENTTQHLVTDIEHLRKKLKVNQIILAGRSWGTTLALTYAQTYPQNVSGMVLCGVFTGTKSEIDHIFHGGVALYFPRVYQDFLNALPEPGVRPLPAYLYRLLREGDKKTRFNVARAWGKYAIRISTLEISGKRVEEILKSYDPFPNAYFESYYMTNGAFLEEAQLLRNAEKIAHIPTVIINGRYDIICPLKTAYRLHHVLPKSKLVIVERAGHSGSAPVMENAFIEAISLF
ncbi:MAG: prolyl aminopeptidase [bacterium]|nr:prolyl aminopeptidase [bacterium]